MTERSVFLQEQAEKLRALVRTLEWSHDAIIGATLDGIITSWNRGARKIYGYHDDEIIGKPVTTLVSPDRAGEIKIIFDELRHGRTVENYETVRRTKHGEEIDLSITASPVHDSEGNPVGVTAVCRDITAQKRAEAALHESERQYRLLFESNPVPMWVFDQATLRFLAVNEAAVRQYGYSRAEFLRMTIRDIRPQEDLSAFLNAISTPARGLTNFGIWRHRRRDGSIVYVEITSHDLVFNGSPAELVMSHDVTHRIKSEQQLRQSEARFSKAFRSSPLAISIATHEGRYIDVNDAFLRLLERSRDQVVGELTEDVGVWADLADRRAMLAQLDAKGTVSRYRSQFRTYSGELRQVLISAELIELDDRPCILAITEDISEVERLERQFRQAQRMEAVGRLAGGIAHDFNNVLGVILGYTEILQCRFRDDEVAAMQLAQVREATDRASALTRHLLAFSRQQALQPRWLDLNHLVRGICPILERVLGENVRLQINTCADIGTINADPTQVEQILMNLVVNARDAMPSGGELTIGTQNVELSDGYVRDHPGSRSGPFVMLTVSDTGGGIPAEVLPHIFEPFFTTKPADQGTGLGLSTVYGIVKQSEGYISVDTETGKGSTFSVFFPRVA